MIGFTGQTYIVPTSARKNILFPGFLLVTAFYQKLHEKNNIVNSSKAGEKISMFRCHQAVTRAVTRAAFSGVTLIMRLRLPTVGWVVQQSAKNLPSAPYRVICDISIVNTKFLNEDDVHMIFLSLFLCSWSLSCNRKVFSLPLSAWRCCSVAVMESELQARDRIGVQDFVLLEDFQSEDAFLENLKKRYNSGLIYVSTRNT